MTKSEIHDIFDIPLTTLSEWQKPESRKHKLYSFLIKSDKEIVEKTTNKRKSHRLFHILNRNIDKTQQYKYDEIQKAFLKESYFDATKREQLIYSKFFKEFEGDELDELCSVFDVNKRTIKKLYLSSPYNKLKGVSKVWNRRFRVRTSNLDSSDTDRVIPSTLQSIIERRTLNV